MSKGSAAERVGGVCWVPPQRGGSGHARRQLGLSVPLSSPGARAIRGRIQRLLLSDLKNGYKQRLTPSMGTEMLTSQNECSSWGSPT